MAHWLLKSEPDVYSYDDLVQEGVTLWTGVRNHAAALNQKRMQVGDTCFFYHSNQGREIVATCRIVAPAAPDPTDESQRFVAVKVAPGRKLVRAVTLAEMKADPALAGFELIRQSRLSVVPVRDAEWAHILALSGGEQARG